MKDECFVILASSDLCAINEPRATNGSPDFASKHERLGPFVAQSSIRVVKALANGFQYSRCLLQSELVIGALEIGDF